jgi:hypothetical protein
MDRDEPSKVVDGKMSDDQEKIPQSAIISNIDEYLGKNSLLANEREQRIYVSAFDRTMRMGDHFIDIDAADHNGLLAVRRFRERVGSIKKPI